jgi:hypothetical protein
LLVEVLEVVIVVVLEQVVVEVAVYVPQWLILEEAQVQL